ncbi:MAG TPA: FAD-dependent oxidoreductase [Chloroflexia bacterium]|nr:FAD-dependent oxidoreductase [Chloroflexia bacterium]
MRVAVIGGGGAGLTSAWLLEERHEVTLYEKETRLGGHAHTLTLDVDGKPVNIDGGFEFISDSMFPTFMRFLRYLNVPLAPYQLTVTFFNTHNNDFYLMPPYHGWQLFPKGFAPNKLLDLLSFLRIVRASKPLIQAQDKSLTIEQYLDSLGVSEAFRRRFMYPYFQAQWGVSVEDVKTFIAYDALKYSYLNLPATPIPHTWQEIEGGTASYVQKLVDSFNNVRVRTGTGVCNIERTPDGYRVIDTNGEAHIYDHIVLATNANQAASALVTVEGTEAVRRYLNQISYFDTTIAIHSDTRLMPLQRKYWSVANLRYDGTYCQYSMWRSGKSSTTPVFKSWVTHDKVLPDKLYATVKYLHPRVDAAYFGAQAALQPFQGQKNIWLAGMYMVDVDCHESAINSAIAVGKRLAPDSARLSMLTAPV